MKILLNGVGRIGKAILRISNSIDSFEIIAINEINTHLKNIVYSINYDSTYGKIDDKFQLQNNYITNSKQKIKLINHNSLEEIDFKALGVDIVIDASGAKIDKEMLKSLDIKAIFLTHPNKEADINVIMGVNDNHLTKEHKIISTSSCNATALLPALKILDDNFHVEFGDIVTVHPLLNHQKTLDSACIGSKDRDVDCNFEFGRSSLQNIIPSQTTTVTACSFVMSYINTDRFSSNSFRVPTSTVGAIEVTAIVAQEVNKEKVILAFKEFESKQNVKILLNNYCPLVSSDFEKEEYTTIIDHRFTDVKGRKMVKLVIWYDNEWGYASKVTEIVKRYINL